MPRFIIYLTLLPIFCLATPSEETLKALYYSLDPCSISKQLAFYHLYPDNEFGKQARHNAWKLLNKHKKVPISFDPTLVLPELNIDFMINYVNRSQVNQEFDLGDSQLQFIENLSSELANRKLKGNQIWKKEDLYSLSSEDIDLARSILLYQFENDPKKVREYEALIDLMTLQIQAYLKENATDEEKIYAINEFIFHDMQFRFPPHSLWVKDIDTYTFLPSVLDSRHGVCLGVSILYLSIAQRLDLPLRIITPPGHIYLAYSNNNTLRNIETTARGIHIPTSQYLGINTKQLKERCLKEVVGLNFINQASVLLHRKDYPEAVKLYEEASQYIEDDHTLSRLLAYSYYLNNQPNKAHPIINWLLSNQDPLVFSQDKLEEDLLHNRADASCIEAIFETVDETKGSIMAKQQKLKQATDKYPKCHDAWFHLGITYLQLSRTKEAYECFIACNQLKNNDATTLYYLTMLCMERLNYPKAYIYLKQLDKLLKTHDRYTFLIEPIKLNVSMNYLARGKA